MADDMFSSSPESGRIIEEPLADALSQRYLAYALSTITARALPDVRDGMKPVHRRILYAMRRMNLDPGSPFRKSAKVVGEVMGNYHPHGDTAIYDAMVRLAQDFSVRYPLVDGQGNFGNVDGDNPAAMRYTESRLTRAAELLLDGIDEDAVDYRATYDGLDKEPVVLPAGFPNLLANGAAGIAVGMATSIPPHNVAELIDAAQLLIDTPDATIDDILAHVPGPDFPTGGLLVEPREAIREAYLTGRGGFRIRARWEVEELTRGQWRIIVTEIPYQVQKNKLIAELADLIESKKAPLLGDVRDESAETCRLVLEPKTRTVEPAVLMESLFRLSELENRFPLNLNVLDATGAPRVMSLKDALQAWLEHQRIVLQRRSAFRLTKIAERLETLAALLIAFLNLDEVIRIIRTEDEPKPVLVQRFTISDVQAEAILNTRLRQLRKLEEMEIKREDAALKKEQAGLTALLASPAKQWAKISETLAKVKEQFGPANPWGKRRSTLTLAPEIAEMTVDAFVVREPITVVLSQKGWIRALKGHVEDLATVKFRDGDELAFAVACETTDKIIAFASDGRAFTLSGDKLPGGRGLGEPIRLMIELAEETEIIAMFPHDPNARRLLASADGYGFIVSEVELIAAKKAGKQVLNGQALVCEPAAGDRIAVIGDNRKLLIFSADELPEMPRGKGVKLQSYQKGGLADAIMFDAKEGLAWIDGAGRTRAVAEWKDYLAKRAGAGFVAPKGFSRNGKFRGG
ncbi:MAG: DNA topoisomerase IV subunit A [Caulobacterales bacterium]|jgi:topoisomerase-4 subunit A